MYDPLYFLVIFMFILSLIVQGKVRSDYRKFSRVASERGLRAEQAVQMVLDYYDITDVEIVRVAGNLTDHFDPRKNIIALSEPVYGSTSIAAIGVACHEAGHAAQHAKGYVPIKVRNSLVPITQIGSFLGIPLAILGVILNTFNLVIIGLALYTCVAIFQFVTLPVELNASKRALAVINETDILTDEERHGAKKVLTSAAMTYIMALATTLVNLLRFASIFLGGRRR
ncbi:MAG: zinc metallopeptidase [Ruminococcaceae bacterium]|nr:zinc metallopeptidase [Oscillospiraceae bacterium]